MKWTFRFAYWIDERRSAVCLLKQFRIFPVLFAKYSASSRHIPGVVLKQKRHTTYRECADLLYLLVQDAALAYPLQVLDDQLFSTNQTEGSAEGSVVFKR